MTEQIIGRIRRQGIVSVKVMIVLTTIAALIIPMAFSQTAFADKPYIGA